MKSIAVPIDEDKKIGAPMPPGTRVITMNMPKSKYNNAHGTTTAGRCEPGRLAVKFDDPALATRAIRTNNLEREPVVEDDDAVYVDDEAKPKPVHQQPKDKSMPAVPDSSRGGDQVLCKEAKRTGMEAACSPFFRSPKSTRPISKVLAVFRCSRGVAAVVVFIMPWPGALHSRSKGRRIPTFRRVVDKAQIGDAPHAPQPAKKNDGKQLTELVLILVFKCNSHGAQVFF